MPWQIAVVNAGGVPQTEVEAFAAAADERFNTELLPAWPEFAGGRIRAVPLGDEPERDEVPVTLTVSVTEPNALAFHSRTLWGLPTGSVELPQCTRYAVPWTVACCHEIDEIFGNPRLDQFVAVAGRRYPREIVDFVTADEMAGPGGVKLSNAVTPAFFEANPAPGARLDLMGQLSRPLSQGGVPPGGWAQWQNPDGSYAAAYGDAVTPALRAYLDAKRGRAWRLARLIGA